MINRRLFYVGYFLLLLPLASRAEQATVQYVKGKAVSSFYQSGFDEEGRQTRDLVEKDLVQGMSLKESASVRTYEKALVILRMEDGSTVKVEENSLLEIQSLIAKKDEAEESYDGATKIQMKAGAVMVRVINSFSGAPSFEIDTPKGVSLGVRGTEFFTGVDDESGEVWTSVNEGEVEALDYANDDSEVIGKGKSMIIEKKGEITKPGEFEWDDKLNWSQDPGKGEVSTNFASLRKKRREEFASRVKELRDRRRKSFKDRLTKWREQGLKGRKARLVDRVKKARENVNRKKEKIQKLRDNRNAQKPDRKQLRENIQKKREVLRNRAVERRFPPR